MDGDDCSLLAYNYKFCARVCIMEVHLSHARSCMHACIASFYASDSEQFGMSKVIFLSSHQRGR
eukprot:COSAG02_NODE_6775_length_3365_cov_1.431151_4_plen_64_part_00